MRLPSPSMAVALVALMVALGGTGYAAIELPKNSVGTKQIKKNAVTGAKVKNGSLLSRDFAAGQIPRGDRGPAGPSNVLFASDPDGVEVNKAAGSSATILKMPSVPAGSYLVLGTVNAFKGFSNDSPAIDRFTCWMTINGNRLPNDSAGAAALTTTAFVQMITVHEAITLSQTSQVALVCGHDSEESTNPVIFGYPRLSLTHTGAIKTVPQ